MVSAQTSEPRSGTAITAAVFAAISGFFHAFGLIVMVLDAFDSGLTVASAFTLVVNAAVCVALLVGAVHLCVRRPYARLLLIGGEVAALLMYVVFATGFAVGTGSFTGRALLVIGAPAVLALLLTLAPSTRRWVTSATTR
ncbi:hypothetical protein [Amycolatopsis suaedae]|uniref:Uncharacterized protein n=1 Tax=Amycolatopsis suaedae TaxID=2510978 RepID=A0A4Q7J791_9PSEU|nr:hypothetical protein [Amycolatopsis suaedae]RZQ63531.1 hypothetical protein EWH70_13990 [Amycolatopsis suaedae]